MSLRSEPTKPSGLQILFQAPELTVAKRIAADPVYALKKAEDIGYVDGFFDRHSVAHEFHSGSEWLAWLKGWRVGQKELHRQKQSAANLMEAMSGQLRQLNE
jgi:hypothetical protein